MKTLQEAAQTALDVQNACNLSGVVHSFSEVMRVLNEESRKGAGNGFGTNWTNEHPICRLFIEQIAHLNGCAVRDTAKSDYFKAYRECEAVAKGEAVAV